MYFDHERYDCYRVALGVAQWAFDVPVPVARKHLRDQLTRAADSMVLNVAEGLSLRGAARCNHLRIALGSAGEVAAVLDLLRVEATDQREALHRVGAMLAKMSRRR